MGDVDARVHIFTATALGRDRVASPTLDRRYPGKAPATHFIGDWVGPRTPVDPDTRAVHPAVKRLAWSNDMNIIM